MKKKILAILIIAALMLQLAACEKNASSEPETNNEQVAVEENIFSVELTIPADFVGETTQEELDQSVVEKGYKSITLNEDGSATYVMTKAQHKELLSELETNISSELDAMIESEDFPNFTEIETNSDFTSFTITTKSESLDLNESFSVMGFYLFGAMYNTFAGNDVDNIHVDFINADSGEIISSGDSSDLADASLEDEEDSTTSEVTYSDTDNIIDFETASYKVTYTKHETGTDWDGNPCLYFYYTFTNNSEDNTSAMASAYMQCFQNGIQCDTAFVDYNTEMDNYMKDVQPGTTIEVCECYVLSDNSEVTIETSDWLSFSDDKDVQTISLE